MSQTKMIFKTNDLRFAFDHGKNEAPQQVDYGSFEVYSGDFVLLSGANGSGKSTFLKLFAGNADYGNVAKGSEIFFPSLSDKNLFAYRDAERAALNRAIVYVGQDDQFDPYSTGYRVLFEPCATAIRYGSAPSAKKKELLQQLKDAVREYFEKYLKYSLKCSYFTFCYKSVRGWSGGQQKMIHVLSGLLKARFLQCPLLLLDEPLNNLDARYKGYVSQLVQDISQQKTCAVILVTHCRIFRGINRLLEISPADERGILHAHIRNDTSVVHEDCLQQMSEE